MKQHKGTERRAEGERGYEMLVIVSPERGSWAEFGLI